MQDLINVKLSDMKWTQFKITNRAKRSIKESGSLKEFATQQEGVSRVGEGIIAVSQKNNNFSSTSFLLAFHNEAPCFHLHQPPMLRATSRGRGLALREEFVTCIGKLCCLLPGFASATAPLFPSGCLSAPIIKLLFD